MSDEPKPNDTTVETDAPAGATPNGMHVKIYAPFKTYFDGPADSVSAVNDTGPFDVLGKHHNFMTLLNQCEVVVRTGAEEQKIAISRGVMHVKDNQVIVFLDV